MKKLIISFIILISAITSTVFAADPDIFIIKPIGEPSESGYQDYGFFDSNGNKIEPVKRDSPISSFSTLPEKYDSRDYGYISPVRNQGSFGTCWAHAFVACAEANMIKKGYEEQFNNYSELHLAYFYHKRDEAQGDGIDQFDEKYGYLGGGNGIYAAQFAESFQDLAVESDFPYSLASNSPDFSIDESFRNHSDVHMIDYGKVIDNEDAKKAIMQYGAISLGLAYFDNFLSEDFGYYQNTFINAANHEVAVVGWDDSFPVEKFNEDCRPANPGAWLIKNSYGKMHGDFGYFWLSYEDPSIKLGNYYEFEPIGDETKVHSYNGGIGINTLGWNIPKSANVFEAKEDQTIYAVGFDSVTGSIVPEKYEINVYISDGSPSTPESGTLMAKLTGDISHDGFHHINLERPLRLSKGQYLSVVVKQTNERNQYAASVFEHGDNYTSREGESYAYAGGKWINMYNYINGDYNIKNSTIKAYYKTDTATVTFNTRQAEHFDTQTVKVGECADRPEDPALEGYEFLGWYTNNTVTEEWDFSQPVQHSMVLFAKWSEPENIDTKVKSRYFGGSYYPGITLSADNIKNYNFYFAKDQKPYTYTATFDSSYLAQWRYWNIPLGSYEVFADVTGVNGEEITSDIETFTVTDQPALSVHEGFINIVNIPAYGADLYVAQFDSEGRFLEAKKTTYYRSYANNGTDIISHKSFASASGLTNPKYLLWNAETAIPLCQPD